MPARLPGIPADSCACPSSSLPASCAVTHPPAQVAEVRAVLQPQAPLPRYTSSARNSIRSRAWVAPIEVRGAEVAGVSCWVGSVPQLAAAFAAAAWRCLPAELLP
jgi:hypothetical protein